MVGKTISHYKIIEKLGEGGMGVVYKAQDTKLKRTVALKFLPPELTREKEAKNRFVHEARAAAALNHPNIVTIYEINKHENQIYIAMEMVEGETIKDKITSTPLPLTEAINMAIQTAKGLQRAHESNIIHRDIKSANIIVSKRNEVKILDFGLAKLRGQTKLTKESTTLGTVAYMSPEQTTGETLDHRSDIWSLGVVFYEMLTGQLPFRGHYEQAIIYSIMNEEPEPLKELIPDVPIQLEQIFKKMLAKDPSQRYPNLNEFLEDLKRFKKGKELKEITIEPKYKIILTPKSLALGFFFLAAIIIAAYFIFKGKAEPVLPPVEPDKKPSLAVLYFENDSGDKTLDVWRYSLAKLLITDLSQSRFMNVLPTDQLHSVLNELKLTETKNYTTEHLLEIGKRAKVNHVLTSSFIKVGDNFAITAMLKNLETNKVLHAFKLTAKNENDIFPKIDELTREIKVELNLTEQQLASDIDQSIIDVTTSNIEALKHFIEGEKYHHTFNKRGRLKLSEAIKSLKLAIKLDPDFAMAYEILSTCYTNLDKNKESNYYKQKAVELKDRLPIKERYIIESRFYIDQEQYDLAIQKLHDLLKIYPDHVNARHRIAWSYTEVNEFKKAIEQYNLIKNKQGLHYNGLVYSYLYLGDYEKARRIEKEWFNRFKNFRFHSWKMAVIYILDRKFDQARDWLKRRFAIIKNEEEKKQKTNLWISHLEFYKGNINKAHQMFKNLSKETLHKNVNNARLIRFIAAIQLAKGQIKEVFANYDKVYQLRVKSVGELKNSKGIPELISHLNLKGSLYQRTAKYQKALDMFRQADNLIPGEGVWSKVVRLVYKRENLFNLVLTYTEMGNLEKAETFFKELRQAIPDVLKETFPKTRERSWILFLRGRIELERKNFAEAVDNLKKAERLLIAGGFWDWDFKNAIVMYFLARAYKLNGNIPEAIMTYEKITRMTVLRFNYGDLFAKSYYHLGKLYQEKGWKGKAIENYNKFVKLWKECDPLLKPMVDNARKRVRKLEGKK